MKLRQNPRRRIARALERIRRVARHDMHIATLFSYWMRREVRVLPIQQLCARHYGPSSSIHSQTLFGFFHRRCLTIYVDTATCHRYREPLDVTIVHELQHFHNHRVDPAMTAIDDEVSARRTDEYYASRCRHWPYATRRYCRLIHELYADYF